MSASTKFVAITKADFPAWKQMRMELYHALDDDFHDQEMKQINSSKDWFCRFIINDDGDVMGMIEISFRNIVDGCLGSPVPYIEGLYLYQRFRNQGHGKEILEMIAAWCREQGYTELATDARIENTKAHKFYKSAGFEETDRVVEFRLDLGSRK